MVIPRRNLLMGVGQCLLAAPLAYRALTHYAMAQPKRVLNIRDFGAAGDGATKDTAAIQQALDRCWVLGGGEVLVLRSGNAISRALDRSPAQHDSPP